MENEQIEQINYISPSLKIDDLKSLEQYFEDLKGRKILSKDDLVNWIFDKDDLESTINEDAAWRYIRYTCHTDNEDITKSYIDFINVISPYIKPKFHDLDTILLNNEFSKELEGKAYEIYLRSLKKDVDLFREESIDLQTKEQELNQQYSQIQAGQTIHYSGEELTLQQAAVYLKDNNRTVRKEVYELLVERRAQNTDKLHEILSELVAIRHQIALNAGFENFRDYKFVQLGRFDYTNKDVIDFHQSVKNIIVPLVTKKLLVKQSKLGLSELKPYDITAELPGNKALRPYETSTELIEKSIKVFTAIHPKMGEYLTNMKDSALLDLDTRKGKAPGGYNYPLDKTKKPFIFMNASGKHRDMVTMMHEVGHAIHTFQSAALPLNIFRHVPSEFSEVASMSMELISMSHWQDFFDNEEDFKRAKHELLDGILESLTWIANVDKFQQWLYTNPTHKVSERNEAWVKIYQEFHSGDVNWIGYESALDTMWQRQLHIYEVPFYYIEYGFAQLGALAVWKNYLANPSVAIEQYMNALASGYTKTIPELYEEAGIAFKFDESYIKDLSATLITELEKYESN